MQQWHVDEVMHLLTRLKVRCHEGSQGPELYDWKQVARSLHPR